MRILYYTNSFVKDSEVQDFLSISHHVTRITERPTIEKLAGSNFDILVSDRSRFIIPMDVIEMFQGMICNLHPSFLPFNRGDQPLLWASIEETPYGVTLHKVNERFDEGPIVSQSRFALSSKVSLRVAYLIVRTHMVDLFKSAWTSGLLLDALKEPNLLIKNDVLQGSTKSRAQGRAAVAILPFGWDTTIEYLKVNKNQFLAL